MKRYIRGVGSGLPIVREYLESSHGTITIEDNMGAGSVVTISVENDARGDGKTLSQERMQPQAQSATQVSSQADPQISQIQEQRAPHHLNPQAQLQLTGTYERVDSYPIDQSQPYMQPQYIPANPQIQQQYQPYPAQPAAAHNIYTPAPQNQAFQSYAPQGGYARGGAHVHPAIAALSAKERDLLPIFLSEGALGITELCNILDIPNSSLFNMLRKLEEAGLVEKMANKKRMLTPLGLEVAQSL